MKKIAIIKDEDFKLNSLEMIEPKIRKASRGIVIREEDGKIAVQYKRKKNQYKLVGGGIEKDEDPKSAFIREIKEETGCEIEIIEELGIVEEYRTHKNFNQISYVFVGKVLRDTKELNLTEKEIDEGAELVWKTPQEVLKLIRDNYDKLIESKYENLYSSRFVALRDMKIIEFYLKNTDKVIN